MKVWPIKKPLKNEHIVGVQPSLAPDVDAGWNRRLNLFTGRALSDTALKAEQAGRAGRMATRGQMVSPGVVTGLQLAVERGAGDALFGQLSAGLGIAVSGEDVVVPTDVRFDLRQVRVYAPGGLLAAAIPPEERANSGLSAYGWDTGPRLGAFMQPDNLLPRAGIVVLQPIVADLVGELDPAEQCEIDPTNDPYEDWQLADGCRVLYYAWPDLLSPQLPPATLDAARALAGLSRARALEQFADGYPAHARAGEALVDAARARDAAGDPDGSCEDFARAVAEHPASRAAPDAIDGLAACEQRRGRAAEAKRLQVRLAKEHPDSPAGKRARELAPAAQEPQRRLQDQPPRLDEHLRLHGRGPLVVQRVDGRPQRLEAIGVANEDEGTRHFIRRGARLRRQALCLPPSPPVRQVARVRIPQ